MSLDNLIADIYSKIDVLNDGKNIDIDDKTLEDFGASMANVLKQWARPDKTNEAFHLRMSNVGKPFRQLWFEKQKEEESRRLSPSLYIKFLYGHLLEEFLLLLVKTAGYQVTDEQKEIEVEGIKGHMDCKINGHVVDVKSASGFSFGKFKKGSLSEDDPFGYLAQLAGYEEAEKSEDGGFLVINKETGELCLHRPEDLDKPNIRQRIKDLKKALMLETPPDFCYPPVAEGKKGNYRIAKNCVYCPFKKECFKESNNNKGLRAFKYAKGLTYFTALKVKPLVEEVYEF
jgi:hypothetical protein